MQTRFAALWAALLTAAPLSLCAAAKVDFKRDVQPIFRANCIGCHGPIQQKNGFRLDRRSAAMRGGTIAVIGPGNASGSRLYLRLIGSDFGMQMPPTGPLPAAQIEIIKNWIDQGAEWPDDAAGETSPPAPDRQATLLIEALRDGNREMVRKVFAGDPKVVSRKGPGGSTPLMYAVLYSDADTVRQFLEAGADPNLSNDAGATALMWAADDLEKTRLLVDHGARVNVHSDYGRTPLMIAAEQTNNAQVVKLLLDHGADPSAESPGLFGPRTPLSEAASVGDAQVIRMLLDKGADSNASAFAAALNGLASGCVQCAGLFLKPAMATQLAVHLGPPLLTGAMIPRMLDLGADANARDEQGRPLIVLAASSDDVLVATEVVKSLIAHGADVNAKTPEGETALDLASRRGDTAVARVLIEAHAKPGRAPAPELAPKPAINARAAVLRSIPLLQKADAMFLQKAGCVSCHNNSLEAVVMGTARKAGLPVDETLVKGDLKTVGDYAESWRERSLQGIGVPGDQDTMSPLLMGLAAENYPADAATDAFAMFLKSKQLSNGVWPVMANRPPIETSALVTTVQTMRAIQMYAPRSRRAEYQKSVDLAAAWIAKAEPQDTQERAFQLLALKWTSASRERIQQAARALIGQQRTDGGWAEIPTLGSDAYATGQALYALHEAGAVTASAAAYQQGVRFLVRSQLEDGSWHLASRAARVQPYFESGFPHGHDQWLSAAGTCWATLALIPAAASGR